MRWKEYGEIEKEVWMKRKNSSMDEKESTCGGVVRK